jgi:hypothetical protein
MGRDPTKNKHTPLPIGRPLRTGMMKRRIVSEKEV